MGEKAPRVADVGSAIESRVNQLRVDAEASMAADLETLRRRVFAAPPPPGVHGG